MSTQLGGSRSLLLQVQAGAKPDLLLLADDLGSELSGLEKVKIKNFARNSLVLVTPKDRTDWPGLGSAQSRLAVADPKSAPLGHYTQQFLTQEETRAQLVPLKDARAVAAAIRLGHVDAGVIYRSDLHGESGLVEAAPISDTAHDPIHYQAILFEPAQPKSKALFDWLSTKEARESLEAAGFET